MLITKKVEAMVDLQRTFMYSYSAVRDYLVGWSSPSGVGIPSSAFIADVDALPETFSGCLDPSDPFMVGEGVKGGY